MTDPTKDPPRDLHPGEASEHHKASDPARRGSVPPGEVGRGAVRHNRSVGWRSRDIVRTAGLVLGMYLLVQLIWYANALFLLIFLGILFAIAISAGVDRLQRLGVPRGMGAALIVIVFFGLLGGFGAWMAPVLRAQGAELRVKMPQAIDRVEEWLNRRQSGMLGVFFGGGLAPAAGADTAAPAAGATAPVPAPALLRPPRRARPHRQPILPSRSRRPEPTLRRPLPSMGSGACYSSNSAARRAICSASCRTRWQRSAASCWSSS